MRLGRIIFIATQWFWNLTYEFKMVGSHLLKQRTTKQFVHGDPSAAFNCYCCFHFSLQLFVRCFFSLLVFSLLLLQNCVLLHHGRPDT